MNRLNITISENVLCHLQLRKVYVIKSKKNFYQLINRAWSSSFINHSPSQVGPIDFLSTYTHYVFGIFYLLTPFHCIFLFQINTN